MEEKNNYVTDKEVDMIGVTIEKERGKEQVRKIRFKTKEFDITFKPSTPTEEFRNGMTISGSRQITVDEIPKKVQEIAEQIQKNQVCRMKVNYGLYPTTNAEGDEVVYKYISYASQLDKWEIL